MKELAKGIRINILSNCLRFSRVGFFALAATLYGLEAFGVYTVVWATVEILIRVGYLGLDQGMLFELAHFRQTNADDKLYKKIVSGLKICLPLAILESVALALYAKWTVDTVAIRQALFLMIPFIPLYIVATLLLQATMGLKKAKYSALIRGGAEPASLMLFALLFWFTPFKEMGVILAQAASLFVTSLLSLWAFGRLFSWKKVWEALSWKVHFRSVIDYSLPMQLICIFDTLFYRMDIYFITYFLGTGSLEQRRLLGVYGLAKQIARVIIQTQTAFSQIFAPVTSESYLNRDEKGLWRQFWYTMEKLFLLNCVFVLALGFFGMDILRLLGGDATLLPPASYLWLLAGQFFYSTTFLLMVFLVTQQRSRHFIIGEWVVFILAVILGVFAVQKWQTTGVAFVTFFCYFWISLIAIVEVVRCYRCRTPTPTTLSQVSDT